MKHQKSINSDHVRRRNVPSPENEQVSQRLSELITPAVFAEDPAYAKNWKIFPQISRQVFDRMNR